MNISTTKIETLLAERGMTKAALSEAVEFPGRTSAPSSGGEPVSLRQRASWHWDWASR